MNDRAGSWLAAAEAAERLGVSRATLYAYVSRGFIRSQASARSVRERVYAREDVERLVRTFYTRAFDDPLLGPVFLDVAHLDLEAHLPVMCDFWETVLFRPGLYRRNAFGRLQGDRQRIVEPAHRQLSTTTGGRFN